MNATCDGVPRPWAKGHYLQQGEDGRGRISACWRPDKDREMFPVSPFTALLTLNRRKVKSRASRNRK
jgi:hypothetical protein